jgi:autotransporter-associated beta strand protein
VKKWNVPLFHPQATVFYGHWVGKHSEVKMKIFGECFLANFRLFKRPVAVFFASAFLLFPAGAQSLYWDANGTNSGGSSNTVASGTWGADNFWSTSSTGTNATAGWTSGGTAIFSAGTNVIGVYTVNVSGNQTAAGITFQAGTVTLNGGTVTLTGGAKITVSSGLAAIINSALAGTAGLTKAGSGTLTLNGNNTFFGNLTNSAGTLILTSSNNYSGVTLLSSGTIDIGNQSALGHSTLNLAGGTLQAFNTDESFGNDVDLPLFALNVKVPSKFKKSQPIPAPAFTSLNSKTAVAPPFQVSLAVVNRPTALSPAEMTAPEFKVIGPLMIPVPPRVALLLTLTLLVPVALPVVLSASKIP